MNYGGRPLSSLSSNNNSTTSFASQSSTAPLLSPDAIRYELDNYSMDIDPNSSSNSNTDSVESQPKLVDLDRVEVESGERPTDLGQPSTATTSGSHPALNRFRYNAQRVIAANRVKSVKRTPGESPGIDLSRSYNKTFEKLISQVTVTCTDYSADKVVVKEGLDNSNLAAFLEVPRPEFSKVRWLNVQGLSFDVIKMLALHYNLHPLAVEDILHIPQRTKADMYGHLFVSIILVSLIDYLKREGHSHEHLHQTSPTAATATETRTLADKFNTTRRRPKRRGSLFSRSPAHMEQSYLRTPLSQFRVGASNINNNLEDHHSPRDSLLNNSRVDRVYVEQASIFLLEDGTVISLFQNGAEFVTKPIMARINTAKTLIRDSEDSSFLLHSIIDSIIDFAMPVVDSYAEEIAKLESKVFDGPKARYTRELHSLQSELRLLRRVLAPSQHLIQTLKTKVGYQPTGKEDEDDRRSISSRASPRKFVASMAKLNENSDFVKLSGGNYISSLTRVYLNDVFDHTNTLVESLDSLSGSCKDLIDLTFNTINHSTNQSMQTISILSVIFLPTTFISSVFGMNFEHFPELKYEMGVLYFWIICIIVTLVFGVLIMVLQMRGSWKSWKMYLKH